MKSSELKELSLKELEERIDNERNFLTKLKLNHAISPLDNPIKIRGIRRNIARFATEIKNRQLTENKEN
ncbi:MAG: 50S ribosomal protein L29 [Bacteroidota bacterium]|nr:50S ribosomal protein L29 [Bacteroidota bacterium]